MQVLPKPAGATDCRGYATIGTDIVLGRADGLRMEMTPIRWVDGIPEELPHPATASSVEIQGASESGLVGGIWREQSPDFPWPFLLVGDEFFDLASSILPEFPYGVQVNGMNDHGTLVAHGTAYGAGATKPDAVVIDWNGHVRVPRPEPWIELYGWSIANDGTVAGYGWQPWPGRPEGLVLKRAFRWSSGNPVELPPLIQHNQTRAFGVNELGQVVGQSEMRFPWGGVGQTTPVIWIDGEPHRLNELAVNVPQPSWMGAPVQITPYGTIVLSGSVASHGVAFVLDPIRERDGDVTLDCRVNLNDLSLVLAEWGNVWALPHGPGDANGDQVVDARDLALVIGDWDAS